MTEKMTLERLTAENEILNAEALADYELMKANRTNETVLMQVIARGEERALKRDNLNHALIDLGRDMLKEALGKTGE